MDISVGFIGGGNMGKALGLGMLKKNLISPQKVSVSGPHINNLMPWTAAGVTNLSENNYDIVCNSQVIFICVKPHIFESMANGIKEAYNEYPIDMRNKIWVSIMAGVTMATLKERLGFYDGAKIIRTMPNTPVDVGCGAVVYAPGPNVTKDEVQIIKTLLEAISICAEVPESMINSVGALSGSGPAYIFQVNLKLKNVLRKF